MKTINSFKGEYEFLSNFYSHNVTYAGLTFKNNEAAFQSAKVFDDEIKIKFTTLNPSEAKRLGRRVKLRSDWENAKDDVMLNVLRAKFSDNTLAKFLLDTGDAELVEGTTGWHDNYWGTCECDKCAGIPGKNMLGKLLTQVRSELRAKWL